MTPDTDDLMPSDTSTMYPLQPVNEEREAKTNAEKAMVQAARPMFEHILKWFELEVAKADSIDQLNPEKGVPLTAQIMATQQLKKKLAQAKSRLEAMQRLYLD